MHAGRDDLGQGGAADSKTTGAAGPRLACCTISTAVEVSGAPPGAPGAWSRAAAVLTALLTAGALLLRVGL